MASTVHQRFVSRLPSLEQEMGEKLFSLYCASLSFTGVPTEEAPLIVAFEDGRYTPEMRALQATRGFGPEGTNLIA